MVRVVSLSKGPGSHKSKENDKHETDIKWSTRASGEGADASPGNDRTYSAAESDHRFVSAAPLSPSFGHGKGIEEAKSISQAQPSTQ